ncbi:MAG: hypothetical protein CMC96_13160 [Flavobacteriales bacterium]|nr:hypothetical protein [Flavobacteriales bacterium]|tara:strand:- start:8407 stop:9171 length:765 start_codon:yes stop_codon:yes gene_type:complete
MNIKRIISIELLKLPVMSNYIILGILLFLDFAFSFLFFYQFSSSASESDSFMDVGRQILNTQASFGGMLICIFIILNVGGEYKNGTLSKNLIDGFSREDFYVGKFFVMLFCVLFALIVGVVSLTIGSLALGKWNDFLHLMDVTFVINFFIQLFYNGIFALFLIFLFKKVAISLVLYFVWGVFENILTGIQYVYFKTQEIDSTFRLDEYLPRSSIEVVLNSTEYIHPSSIVITGIYILLFLLIPYFSFLKSDIKS